MKKTCIMLAIVACLCTACESNKGNVIEEKEPDKIIEQQPEVEEEIQEPEQEEQKQEVTEEEVVEEPQLTEQEKARQELVNKYGEEVVVAWEKLSRDEFFDYIGYELEIKQHHGPEGETYFYCYKILDNGNLQDAYVGGEYYIYGEYVSNEAIFDLVAYHNEFFS